VAEDTLRGPTGKATSTALVLVAGEAPARIPPIPDGSHIVAADGGMEHAATLGLALDAIVGDLDSAPSSGLAAARAAGIVLETYPVDKDATDLELALRHVLDSGCDRVLIVGGGGGRLDHLLANALILAHPDFASLDLEWHVGTAVVQVARPGRNVVVSGAAGDPVTLLAVGGTASGVATRGLRWSLAAAVLEPGTSRGVSNEILADSASVTVTEGALLVIHEKEIR